MTIPKQDTSCNKRNRKYRKNPYRKNNTPKIHFGPIISDRTKNEKGTCNQNKR